MGAFVFAVLLMFLSFVALGCLFIGSFSRFLTGVFFFECGFVCLHDACFAGNSLCCLCGCFRWSIVVAVCRFVLGVSIFRNSFFFGVLIFLCVGSLVLICGGVRSASRS